MNESAERDYEWFEALQSLEKERQRKMGIEWPERAGDEDRGMWKPATAFEFADDYVADMARRCAVVAQRRLNEMERERAERIDWGLLDEFLVYVGQDGLWLQHARCKRPDAPARWRQSVADLVLAVEEHMKECGK